MGKSNVHVIPRDGRWAVRREGAKRDSFHLETQEAALARAKGIAERERVELIIHGLDGAIRESTSYGNDPNPPRDSAN